MIIPTIKKEIKAFLLEERGEIPKNTIIKAGMVLGVASLLANNVLAGAHANGGPDCHANASCPDLSDRAKFVVVPDEHASFSTFTKDGDYSASRPRQLNVMGSAHAACDYCDNEAHVNAAGMEEHCNSTFHENSISFSTDVDTINAKHAHNLTYEGNKAVDHANCWDE